MGRSLETILSWDDERLEYNHDFIQWLFPLRERSGANPTAPVLTDDDVKTFRSDPVIRGNMTRSFDRMMRFYGVEPGSAGSLDGLTGSDLFLSKKDNWLNHANHNYLRMTRILKSLRVAGLNDKSEYLFSILTIIYKSYKPVIGERTFDFWRRAAHDG